VALPRIAVTLGDPAGIGPEIVLRAVMDARVTECCEPVVVGSRAVLERVASETGARIPAGLAVEDCFGGEGVAPGIVQAAAGRAAAAWLQRAVELALAGEVEAMATAPLNKDALSLAGVPYLDHTEGLKQLTASRYVQTMFVLDELRIFFATRHMSLAEAIAALTAESVAEALSEADGSLKRFGLSAPRFALAALNPHAGENGLFGDEETLVLAPAVELARAAGVKVDGPVAADSVFHLCRQGRYDAVMSLYHDQGHIAAKSIDFERTVAITTGLPFVRSSVDHGTAFDIAWQGKASAVSMVEAITAAARYSRLIGG
jgi:4-hydroxythreonine-4-phosphate dehydrogenase